MLVMKGVELKKKRTKAKLSQKELAEMSGISRETIINYEKSDEINPKKCVILNDILDKHISKSVFLNIGGNDFKTPKKAIDSNKVLSDDFKETAIECITNWDKLMQLDFFKNHMEGFVYKEIATNLKKYIEKD